MAVRLKVPPLASLDALVNTARARAIARLEARRIADQASATRREPAMADER
jgi:hypothetical protein